MKILNRGCSLRAFLPWLICGLASSAIVSGRSANLEPPHVIVIGVDGLNPAGIRRADTPHIDRLIQRGAHTFRARAVMPTSSSPNWASMIMGAGPEQHGVTSNDWKPDKFDFPPVATGPGGIFPTIFGLLREQRPDANIAVFHDWEDFRRLLETNSPNVLRHVKDAIETAHAAIGYWKQNTPHLLFIHFDGVDHAGHGFGWTSPQYDRAVELTDSLVGAVLDAVEATGIQEQTVVLLTADHGGKGTKHGGNSLEEIEIPWIVAGPGVRSNYEIEGPVNTYDTAPTLAFLLGVKPPACWIGRPVQEAFTRAMPSTDVTPSPAAAR